MIRCPYCGCVLDYDETIIVNMRERKFYNVYSCSNDKCISNHSVITDCTGVLELGQKGCCYPEEFFALEA